MPARARDRHGCHHFCPPGRDSVIEAAVRLPATHLRRDAPRCPLVEKADYAASNGHLITGATRADAGRVINAAALFRRPRALRGHLARSRGARPVSAVRPVGRLMSVNVGLPKDVAWHGQTVHTGVWKAPVEGPRLVRRLNIDGDGQGDL